MSVNRNGIDVSTWQGDIDWKKVKADGIEFAMLRSKMPNRQEFRLVHIIILILQLWRTQQNKLIFSLV